MACPFGAAPQPPPRPPARRRYSPKARESGAIGEIELAADGQPKISTGSRAPARSVVAGVVDDGLGYDGRMAPHPAIATCCDSILSLNARLGRDFARLLVEGLPRAQILASARKAGLVLPDEVVDLFAWRNGHRDGHSMGNLWLLPGYYLLGLEEALGHRAAVRGHVPDSWLP